MGELLRVNLQFFSGDGFTGDGFDGGGIVSGGEDTEVVRGYYNPDEEIEYPEGANPLWEANEEDVDQQQFDEFQQEGEQGEFEQEQFEQQQPDQNQEYMQRLIQENQMMQQQMNQMMMMQQLQSQQAQQQPAPAPQQQEPQLTPEEQNERLMEKFYENPTGFFDELKQQAIQEARIDIDPIIQEKRIESEVQGLSQRYGQDFLDTVPQMQNLVTQLGDEEVERMGLERVYLMARGMGTTQMAPQDFQQQYQAQPQYQQQYQAPQQLQQQYQAQPQYQTPDQIFQDEQFINDYIAQNPQVQQAVMNQYMANKQQSAPPQVMGSQFGSSPSLAPEERPKSISEASRLLRKSWGI